MKYYVLLVSDDYMAEEWALILCDTDKKKVYQLQKKLNKQVRKDYSFKVAELTNEPNEYMVLYMKKEKEEK